MIRLAKKVVRGLCFVFAGAAVSLGVVVWFVCVAITFGVGVVYSFLTSSKEMVFATVAALLWVGAMALGCMYYEDKITDLKATHATQLKQEQERLEQVQDKLSIASDVLTVVFDEPWDPERLRMEEVEVSAYSSTKKQTDASPWKTASGQDVGPWTCGVSRDLRKTIPNGKRILFSGGGVAIRNDKMNARYVRSVDLWCPDETAAKAFGRKTTTTIWLD